MLDPLCTYADLLKLLAVLALGLLNVLTHHLLG